MWYASYDGASGSPQKQIPGIASSVGPFLAAALLPPAEWKMYAAWKGSDTDQRIWYSTFDGMSWAPQQQIPGASSVGPSLTYLQDRMYGAWKGSNANVRIWFSGLDGATWSPQQLLPGASSTGPRLLGVADVVFAFWKGVVGDERIWYASGVPTLDGFTWSPQAQLPDGAETSYAPSVAIYGESPFLAWKGGLGDDRILWLERYHTLPPP